MTTLKDRPGRSRAQRAGRSEIGGDELRRSVRQHAEPVRGRSQLDGIANRKSLRPAEAAAVLGVCRETVYVLMRSGRLRSIKLAGARLIPIDAIDDLLSAPEEYM